MKKKIANKDKRRKNLKPLEDRKIESKNKVCITVPYVKSSDEIKLDPSQFFTIPESITWINVTTKERQPWNIQA